MLKDHDCGWVVYIIGFQTRPLHLHNFLFHHARDYILFNLQFYFIFILQFVPSMTLKVGQWYVIANYTKSDGPWLHHM
jgi:hypothetical protein